MVNRKLTKAIICACGLSISSVAWGAPFPEGPGVDEAPSLGKFVVTFKKPFVKKVQTQGVHPELKNILCPGRDWSVSPEVPRCTAQNRTIPSPVLSESRTRVGRSEPHYDGDASRDMFGTYVCQKGTLDQCEDFFAARVSDGDFMVQFFPSNMGDGPVGTQEVHTQLLSLNMKKGANAVRAGDALNIDFLDQPELRSIGEVQSLNPPDSDGGFPAESFFLLFAEIDMDVNGDGQVDFTLFNESTEPLIVQGTGLTKFPPKLVYTHSATVWATPLKERNGGVHAIADIRMAGHGINFKCANGERCDRKGTRDGEKSDFELFEEVFESLPLAPINPAGLNDGGEPEPPICQLYAVQDHGRNNSQFFSIFTDNLEVTTISKVLPGLDIESLAAHPTHDMLYAASGDATKHPGVLYSLNADVGEVVEIGETGFGDVPSLSFHSDGTLWGWAKGDGLITIDTKTGKGTLVKAFPEALVEGLSWNPTGTHIYATEDTNLWVYEHATQAVNLACSNLPGETEALEILPDGTLLLGIHGEEKIIQFQGFNPETCEIVFGVDIPTSPTINDVEGIAWPINACSQP